MRIDLSSPLRVFFVGAASALVASLVGVGWMACDLWETQLKSVNLGPLNRAYVQQTPSETRRSVTGPRAVPITAQIIPEHFLNAVIAIEDRRYYSHHGVDPYAIMRAAFANWQSGQLVEGASTLTQQFARTRYLNRDRTYRRKMREVALALWIDSTWEKDEVLAAYIREVYFGAGAYGVSAAADVYFHKSVGDLTLAQSAILAAILNAPSKINPKVNLPAAINRAERVLAAMLDTGVATQAEVNFAGAELVRLATVGARRYDDASRLVK